MNPTPTTNDRLPHRRADFATLPEALDYAARGATGLNFYSGRGELLASLSFKELRERAVSAARALVRSGVPAGSRLLLIADTDADFAVIFCACQYAGILPVPVAVPTSIGGHEAYVAMLRRQLTSCGAALAIAPEPLLAFLREAANGLGMSLVGAPDDLYALPDGGVDIRPFGPDDPSYLQYSSGSTRFPLGVDIPQRALRANCQAIVQHGLDIVEGDRCTSWLPLYHDMGLVGFMLAPIFTQMSVDYLSTREFARRPLKWLSLISRNGGSISFSPTFGFELCVRRAHDRVSEAIDLRTWRIAGIGGDMIQPETLARFAEIFEPSGFRRSAFVPSYGMAETALAISFSKLDDGARIDRVDRRGLADANEAAPSASADPAVFRDLVNCGRPLPGFEVEIRQPDGSPAPDRRIGRLFVRGPSVMAGYFGEPRSTAEVLSSDGWLDTGDLGYGLDGEIVITGRSKDLIIINGRNIWPQDLEWAVEELPKLRRGDAAAITLEDSEGRERVVMLVQCRTSDRMEREELARAVMGVVQRVAATDCEVVLIPAHALPFTSSGKLSRTRAKATYVGGGYGIVAINADQRAAQSAALPPASIAR